MESQNWYLNIKFATKKALHCVRHSKVCTSSTSEKLFVTSGEMDKRMVFAELERKYGISEVVPVDDQSRRT